MVYRAATCEGLGGFVRNDSEGLLVEVEGDDLAAVTRFIGVLRREAPPLARIDAFEVKAVPPRGERDFRVVASMPLSATTACIPADAATCDACVRELFDPSDRRFRYPFINCTDCGPRYTIARDVPYDRAATTMAVFPLCEACRAEYEDPRDRRFHAEPTACSRCGPRVALVERGLPTAEGDAAMVRAAALLGSGAIVALKGLGGYQLAVDARDEAAVARLRAKKRRPDKPFALMARDLAVAELVAHVTPLACAALTSPARPIVLLDASFADGRVAPSVAPRLGELGVMLPATPLHHLLFASGPSLLVMTSGNVADEPIAKDDDDALAKLGAIADAFVVHDRVIHTRADDSVVRVTAGAARVLRRARGCTPEAVPLSVEAPSVVAVGAELKNAVCITRCAEAYLSQHIGDLGSIESRAFFEELIDKLSHLLGVAPTVIAHDLHPEYASTRWALARGLPTIGVQHHHAHIASCLVENGRSGPVIGVAFDGTGCGPAGDLWGGEVLLADFAGFQRLGHLRPIALAGGEAAIREPWRLAVAALLDANEPVDRAADPRRAAVARLVERKVASPLATGAGRWFDAFAALLGVRDRITYEAQAAIELDALASRAPGGRPYPFLVEERAGPPFVVDLRPTVNAVAAAMRRLAPREQTASRVFATMAEVVAVSCQLARRDHGVNVVALSGGCFQSRLFTESARALLEADGFEVLLHRRVPPNDGGIALGQAAVAAHRLGRERAKDGPGKRTKDGGDGDVPGNSW